MAEQKFKIRWYKTISVEVDDIFGWEDMDEFDRAEVIGEIAYDRMQMDGPDDEDVMDI